MTCPLLFPSLAISSVRAPAPRLPCRWTLEWALRFGLEQVGRWERKGSRLCGRGAAPGGSCFLWHQQSASLPPASWAGRFQSPAQVGRLVCSAVRVNQPTWRLASLAVGAAHDFALKHRPHDQSFHCVTGHCPELPAASRYTGHGLAAVGGGGGSSKGLTLQLVSSAEVDVWPVASQAG